VLLGLSEGIFKAVVRHIHLSHLQNENNLEKIQSAISSYSFLSSSDIRGSDSSLMNAFEQVP
jgi:hypothetical protein